MLRFVQQMIALRKRHKSLMRRRFLTGEKVAGRHIADIQWYGADGEPQWLDPEAQVLAFTLAAVDKQEADLHVILNMSEAELVMHLPIIEEREWNLAINTALSSPLDIVLPDQQVPLGHHDYLVLPRSVVVFEGR
jgi:glycogen operon protein